VVDQQDMRLSVLAYGVLYVVVELVGQQLRDVGWARITMLDVATAVTDALLTVAICCAVVLAVHLGWRRWGQPLRAAWRQATPDGAEWDERPIGVSSWRPEPLSLPAAGPAPEPGGTYASNPYSQGRARFPKEPGHLL
jgi:hypothetical protein